MASRGVRGVRQRGEACERGFHHVAGAPAGDAAQRLDGLGDRVDVVADLVPAIARECHVAALVREVDGNAAVARRSEEHTSELQSLMRISYAVFCLKKKNKQTADRSSLYHILNLTISQQSK